MSQTCLNCETIIYCEHEKTDCICCPVMCKNCHVDLATMHCSPEIQSIEVKIDITSSDYCIIDIK